MRCPGTTHRQKPGLFAEPFRDALFPPLGNDLGMTGKDLFPRAVQAGIGVGRSGRRFRGDQTAFFRFWKKQRSFFLQKSLTFTVMQLYYL